MNVPTVTVGNVVTVKGPDSEPVYIQRGLTMLANSRYVNNQYYYVPAGKRLVVDNVNVSCSSTSAQAVAVSLYVPDLGDPIFSVVPTPYGWDSGAYAANLYPVHLVVDDSVTLAAIRSSGMTTTNCAVTLIGSLVPLP